MSRWWLPGSIGEGGWKGLGWLHVLERWSLEGVVLPVSPPQVLWGWYCTWLSLVDTSSLYLTSSLPPSLSLSLSDIPSWVPKPAHLSGLWLCPAAASNWNRKWSSPTISYYSYIVQITSIIIHSLHSCMQCKMWFIACSVACNMAIQAVQVHDNH